MIPNNHTVKIWRKKGCHDQSLLLSYIVAFYLSKICYQTKSNFVKNTYSASDTTWWSSSQRCVRDVRSYPIPHTQFGSTRCISYDRTSRWTGIVRPWQPLKGRYLGGKHCVYERERERERRIRTGRERDRESWTERRWMENVSNSTFSAFSSFYVLYAFLFYNQM